jgi:serine/threonine protein kinase
MDYREAYLHTRGAAHDSLSEEVGEILGRPMLQRTPQVHSIVSHYELLKHIGAGANGTVYLARDLRCDRYVAIKLLRRYRDQQLRHRFLREAKCGLALNHPNIVAVHGLVHHQGMALIVME